MKKIYSVFILFATLGSYAQIINIPDPVFKAKLLSANEGNYIAFSQTSGNVSVKIDTNEDGEIELSEAATIKDIYLDNSGISDLTGIRSFQNLRSLDCESNLLQQLDVSGMIFLNWLFCSSNQLTFMNLNDTRITWLDCSNNALTNLDCTNQLFMNDLNCSNNLLTSLDLTNCHNLWNLRCSNNQLTGLLYTSNFLLNLDCSHNQLTQIDITPSGPFIIEDMVGTCNLSFNPLVDLAAGSTAIYFGEIIMEGLPTLEHICCYPNNETFFQNIITAKGYLNCVVDDSCFLAVENTHALNEFAFFPNPTADVLQFIETKPIDSIAIYNTLGQLVTEVTKPKGHLDVSGLRSGNYYLKINSDKGTSNTKFIKL